MADDDSLSELSSLSSLSPAPSGDDDELELKPDGGILKFFKRVSTDEIADARKSPPPRKREPSPPHEHVFADISDIAFIVMFRKRFDSVMPRSLPHFGPIELEQDIQQDPPAERVEQFLCVVLGLLLNRKQDIKLGHYSKALNEDAINGKDFKIQWPKHWTESPLARGGTFQGLTPERRLDLLKTLVVWALGHSDAIKAVINSGYNGKRTNDDLNQPLSVQPWGFDSDKRRYFLVEGDDNCSFRVYRESNPAALYNRQWISVAGSIDEVKALAEKLATADGGPNARKLSNSILKNIPNFEEKEEKRKRREYRRQQKERFRRPEPGFSLYEGRTRGKRVKYTYDEDEDFYTDSSNRRSMRNTRNHSPVETGPVVTASGRLSRAPPRMNADDLSADVSAAQSVQGDTVDHEMREGSEEFGPTGRPRRAAAVHHGTTGWAHAHKRRRDVLSDDEDESEPDLGDDEEEEHVPLDETDDAEEFENDDAMEEGDQEVLADSPGSNGSRVVKLAIKVKFDKNGKAKRLVDNGDTPSASTPSNIASSPEKADESEDNPSDVQDVVNVAPLKRSQPQISTTTTAAAAAASTAVAASTVGTTDTNGQAKVSGLSPAAEGSAAIATSSVPNGGAIASAESITTTSAKQLPAVNSTASESVHTNGALASVSSNSVVSKPQTSSATSVEKTDFNRLAPGTPLGSASPSLAYRGSPEKLQPLPLPATGSVDRV
ncbi:hypothetical protein N0V93_005640 [Gnomoniopsis smithogilvyi]|uniref:WHIM1 domain-containing protein n=1 Tax=Gnomoniopsis smithogilvyi TaxID=1191159 RepID=A0A9W8YVZ1_9PEZI|nr:hypothetical protein N0V93_005640 [Gnomoniopsis smithogilvyi]